MRRILAAGLFFTPLFLPTAAVASNLATDASTPTEVRSVSTGVIPAQVLYAPNIDLPFNESIPNNAEVVLQLNVDEKGRAEDVQVVKSPNPELDAPVAEAVRKSRFRPAALDHQAIAVPMTLTVVVQR